MGSTTRRTIRGRLPRTADRGRLWRAMLCTYPVCAGEPPEGGYSDGQPDDRSHRDLVEIHPSLTTLALIGLTKIKSWQNVVQYLIERGVHPIQAVGPATPGEAAIRGGPGRLVDGHRGEWHAYDSAAPPGIHRPGIHSRLTARPQVTASQGGEADTMQPVRVLVVDDETTLAELLSMALRYEGWEVRSAADGRGALRLARDFRPDAVVLDIMLPDMDGLEVLRRLRAESPDVPVLFLTARDAVEDRVAGLTAGGDDYVTKPFSLEELVARLRGLMRRAARTTEALQGARLVVGDLTMDEESREVQRAGQPVHLTATEFELLRFFMRNPRRVLSKAQILDRVWNYDFGGQANVVELYVSYLRKKIDAGRPPMIHTMRGAGYVLRPADPALAPRTSATPSSRGTSPGPA
ncbi:two component transcriptional regulator, winged helix family [Frankia casuarinae]|uniref:Two component transcriptional regulator, winged helix family n=2 Tax=Frankiaceae TaxID=74712 RepID=Q2JG84_FRACC|nr:two component transcriptional regulator, winged helix family [Frankia casuarinae]